LRIYKQCKEKGFLEFFLRSTAISEEMKQRRIKQFLGD